jgi:hypothetical protein
VNGLEVAAVPLSLVPPPKINRLAFAGEAVPLSSAPLGDPELLMASETLSRGLFWSKPLYSTITAPAAVMVPVPLNVTVTVSEWFEGF